MELMRKILFAIEEQFEPGAGTIHNINVGSFSLLDVAEHCSLLYQAGLISNYKPLRGDNTIMDFGIGNLTNQGYDYLELIRNDDTWKKTKEKVKENKLPETIESYGKVAASILRTFLREFNR